MSQMGRKAKSKSRCSMSALLTTRQSQDRAAAAPIAGHGGGVRRIDRVGSGFRNEPRSAGPMVLGVPSATDVGVGPGAIKVRDMQYKWNASAPFAEVSSACRQHCAPRRWELVQARAHWPRL